MTTSDASPDPGVFLSQSGPLATVTLSRPDVLNAQTPAMWEELADISRKISGDVRVVIVRGEGRAFSAGLDLSAARAGSEFSFVQLAHLTPEECARRIAGFQSAFTWLRRPSLLTIAAVQGHAIGAGFQLALNCDLRVLTEDARFTMAEVALGLVPDLGGTKRLTELVGPSRALEICVTGRRISADEAERIGLATAVVRAADLDDTVNDLAAAVLEAQPGAVSEIKALIGGALGRTYDEQDRAEREAQTRRLREIAGMDD